MVFQIGANSWQVNDARHASLLKYVTRSDPGHLQDLSIYDQSMVLKLSGEHRSYLWRSDRSGGENDLFACHRPVTWSLGYVARETRPRFVQRGKFDSHSSRISASRKQDAGALQCHENMNEDMIPHR